MSLNVIQLPPFVIKELYKETLVEETRKERKASPPPAAPYAFLGNNSKKIVVIVANDEAVYLPDEELNFLLGVLAACQLTMDDVAVLNFQKNEAVTYTAVSKELGAEKVLLFGVSTQQISLPIDFPHFQLQSYNNQVYLTAPSLATFHNDKAAKTRLWNCLKQLFGI